MESPEPVLAAARAVLAHLNHVATDVCEPPADGGGKDSSAPHTDSAAIGLDGPQAEAITRVREHLYSTARSVRGRDGAAWHAAWSSTPRGSRPALPAVLRSVGDAYASWLGRVVAESGAGRVDCLGLLRDVDAALTEVAAPLVDAWCTAEAVVAEDAAGGCTPTATAACVAAFLDAGLADSDASAAALAEWAASRLAAGSATTTGDAPPVPAPLLVLLPHLAAAPLTPMRAAAASLLRHALCCRDSAVRTDRTFDGAADSDAGGPNTAPTSCATGVGASAHARARTLAHALRCVRSVVRAASARAAAVDAAVLVAASASTEPAAPTDGAATRPAAVASAWATATGDAPAAQAVPVRVPVASTPSGEPPALPVIARPRRPTVLPGAAAAQPAASLSLGGTPPQPPPPALSHALARLRRGLSSHSLRGAAAASSAEFGDGGDSTADDAGSARTAAATTTAAVSADSAAGPQSPHTGGGGGASVTPSGFGGVAATGASARGSPAPPPLNGSPPADVQQSAAGAGNPFGNPFGNPIAPQQAARAEPAAPLVLDSAPRLAGARARDALLSRFNRRGAVGVDAATAAAAEAVVLATCLATAGVPRGHARPCLEFIAAFVRSAAGGVEGERVEGADGGAWATGAPATPGASTDGKGCGGGSDEVRRAVCATRAALRDIAAAAPLLSSPPDGAAARVIADLLHAYPSTSCRASSGRVELHAPTPGAAADAPCALDVAAIAAHLRMLASDFAGDVDESALPLPADVAAAVAALDAAAPRAPLAVGLLERVTAVFVPPLRLPDAVGALGAVPVSRVALSPADVAAWPRALEAWVADRRRVLPARPAPRPQSADWTRGGAAPTGRPRDDDSEDGDLTVRQVAALRAEAANVAATAVRLAAL